MSRRIQIAERIADHAKPLQPMKLERIVTMKLERIVTTLGAGKSTLCLQILSNPGPNKGSKKSTKP